MSEHDTSKKVMIGAAAMVVGLSASVAVAAGGAGGPSPDHRERARARVDALLDDIEATPDQRQVIHEELRAMAPRAMRTHEERRALGQQLGRVALAGRDTERAHQLVDELSELSVTFMHEVADTGLRLHKELDASQRDELARRWDLPRRQIRGSWFVDRGLDRAMVRLEATPEQRALAETQKDAMVREVDALSAQMHPLRQELLVQLRAPEPDAERVHAGVDRAGLLLTNTAHVGADLLMEVTATLTEDQRDEAREAIAERRARRHMRGPM